MRQFSRGWLLLSMLSAALSSTAGAQAPIMSVLELQSLHPVVEQPYKPPVGRDTVQIAGRVTIPSGVLDRARLTFYVEDGTGGIRVYGGREANSVVVRVGDSVVVTGQLASYRGMPEIVGPTVVIPPGPRRAPAPQILRPISRSVLSSATGRLVRVSGTVVAASTGRGDHVVTVVSRGVGVDSTTLDVIETEFGNVSLDLGRFSPGDSVRATGVLVRRTTDGVQRYYLYPRSSVDVTPQQWTLVARRRLSLSLAGAAFLLVTSVVIVRVRRIMGVERGKTEAALRESAAYYRFADDAPIGMFVHRRGRILFANAALAEVAGVGAANVLRGRRLRDLVHPSEWPRLRTWLRQRGTDAEPAVRDEFALTRRDGTALVLSVVGTPTMFEGHPAFQVAVHDITAQRALEGQMNQSQKMQAVGQLAAGVAHDFNNLLTVIKGHSELLLDELEPSNSLRADITEIREAATRATDLTKQLLAFSRKQILYPHELDINTIVSGLEPMLRRVIGADVEMILHADLSIGHVMADAGQLEQVLLNLVVNARDAMPSGGTITISTAEVELDARYAARRDVVTPGSYVMLAVSDTGTGIPPETLNRIFEPFFTTKEQGKGTGLGLATVYGIVKQSGGYVWAYSELQRGSTFKVYLPRVQPSAALISSSAAVQSAIGGSEVLLLVEDEEGVRKLAERILTRHGYTVLVAENGVRGLEVAAAYPGVIDAVVTDMIMPQMGGSDLCTRLKAVRPGIRVLYMSGYTDDNIIQRGLLHSTQAFLEKPFTTHQLLEVLRRILDGDEVPERDAGAECAA